MAPISSNDEKAAKSFYDKFGSVLYVESKTSAYGTGGCTVNGAVKISNGVHGSVSAAPIYHSNGNVKSREYLRPSAGVHLGKSNMARGLTKSNSMWLPKANGSVSNGTNTECKSSTIGSYMEGKPKKVNSMEMWHPKSKEEPTVLCSSDFEANNGRISESPLRQSAGNSSQLNKAEQYVWRRIDKNSVSSVIGKDVESYAVSKNGSCVATNLLNLEAPVIAQSNSQREPSTYALSKNGSPAAAKPLKLDSTAMPQPNSQREPSTYAFSKNGYSVKPLKLDTTVLSQSNSQRERSTYTFSKNDYYEARKPLKLDSAVRSQSNTPNKPSTWCSAKCNTMHKDMEDFMFKMLGDGFQLDRDVIQDILEKCGYDMPKCMDRLTNLSAATLANKKSYSHSDRFRDSTSKLELHSPQSNLQKGHSRGKESNKNQKDIDRLQNEICYTLFDASKKFEESPKAVQPSRTSMALGEVVVGPFEEPTIINNISLTYSRRNDYSGENENYQLLRTAVTEHRATMREYYKDAVTAFSEGYYAKAGTLLKQGSFFKEKAVEADEESYKQLFETRNAETDNVVLLDLHDQEAKDAVHLLKCHLSSLAGIPSFKYLKIIIEKNEEVSKGARRRLVLKLLQRKSIEWSEGDPGTIVLDLEKINPIELSFIRKK